jgi:tRNA pseudouridine55 synthase
MDGLLVIDKPPGITSHDVVDEVRRRLGVRRVGHAGTLDPQATGILVVGVGRATRLLSYAQAGTKRYRADAVFGITTTTQDAWGEVVATRPAQLSRADLEEVLPRFLGALEQTPPMVSAVRVRGERLYRRARRGESVDRPARPIHVRALDLLEWRPGEHPGATLDVTCSPGTYVRTLVSDIGDRLGCGAHLAALRRTESGAYTEADAVSLDRVDAAALRPLEQAVAGLPRLEADRETAARVADGRPLSHPEPGRDGDAVAVVRGSDLLAVYVRRGDALVAERVLARPPAPSGNP